MIRTDSLTKFYGRRCAVKDLTVSIAEHEIVGFLGLNGAGKTTTLRMLAGLLAPSSGRIEIGGKDVAADTAAEHRWQIGFLPERPPVYEDMTVDKYLEFAARLRGFDDNRVMRRVGEVAEMCALTEYIDEVIANLSHGFRQRVGIAQAVIHEPALVILDEPTSGLDPVQIVEMRSLIRNLKEHHTVLVSSHNLPEISQTCDRLLVIKGGQLVMSGSEADLGAKLANNMRVRVEVSGDKATVDSTVAKLTEGEILADATVDTIDGVFEINARMLVDEPEKVSQALFEAGLGLRRLQPSSAELESLFLELSKGGAS